MSDKKQDIPTGAVSIGAAFQEAYKPQRDDFGIAPDGLPALIDPPWTAKDTQPPPLTEETMTCIESDKLGRKRCKFYRRQRIVSNETGGLPMVSRWCTHPSMRGLNGSAFLLNDTAIIDCELRKPRIQASVAALNAVDAKIVQKGRVRLELEQHRDVVYGFTTTLGEGFAPGTIVMQDLKTGEKKAVTDPELIEKINSTLDD